MIAQFLRHSTLRTYIGMNPANTYLLSDVITSVHFTGLIRVKEVQQKALNCLVEPLLNLSDFILLYTYGCNFYISWSASNSVDSADFFLIFFLFNVHKRQPLIPICRLHSLSWKENLSGSFHVEYKTTAVQKTLSSCDFLLP